MMNGTGWDPVAHRAMLRDRQREENFNTPVTRGELLNVLNTLGGGGAQLCARVLSNKWNMNGAGGT